MGNRGRNYLLGRVSELLDRNAESSESVVYREIKILFCAFVHKLFFCVPESYLVGGALRQLNLTSQRTFPRDYDVVVVGCDETTLLKHFGGLVVGRTSLGGFRLEQKILPAGQEAVSYVLRIDLWRLEDSWALRTLNVEKNVQSMVDHAFLNVDAVAVRLDQGSTRRTIVERGYFDAFRNRVIDVNYEMDRNVALCAIRAMLLVDAMRFSIGPRLVKYLLHCDETVKDNEWIDGQVKRFGRIQLGLNELRQWLEFVKREEALHPGAGISVPRFGFRQRRFSFMDSAGGI